MAVKRTRRPPAERPAQRRRTRKAIVDATMALIARGGMPSVNDVAAAADVSRRTIYLYFPSFDQLLLDATVGALSQGSVDRALADLPDGESAEARIERLARAMQDVTPEVERLGRALVRLTVDTPVETTSPDTPRRGYRRIEWIETALAPCRDRLEPAAWRRLVSAVAMVIGWEALVVQRDVCGLTVAEGADASAWSARALVRAALAEARRSRT